MRKEYIEELENLKLQMEAAELFAKKIPLFAEKILKNKYCQEDANLDFGSYYKRMPLAWGIKRHLFNGAGGGHIFNYPKDKEYNLHLFCIYINTCSLFDSHEKFDLYESLEGVDVFFIDKLNSTFYVTDENIEPFLEALYAWFTKASSQLQEYRRLQRIEDLKKELEKQEKLGV